MDTIQNYFVQITITKGRIIQKEDGTLEKIVDETIKDDVTCSNNEDELRNLINV